jgi:hypothetical protein
MGIARMGAMRAPRQERLVSLLLLFRKPEFGHELGTTFAGDNAGGGRADVGIATIVGASCHHRTSAMVSIMPPMRNRTMPLANVVGDPDRMNSPNMTHDTGMIAVLNGLDNMVVILPLAIGCEQRGTRRKEAGASTPPHCGDSYAAIWTLICLGLTSSRSGKRTVRMPAL